MVLILYIVGVIVILPYSISIVSCSMFKINLTWRYIKAILFSLFWFVTIPILIVSGNFGNFFTSPFNRDVKYFNKIQDQEIEKIIAELKTSRRSVEGEPFDEEKVRNQLKQKSGTFYEALYETRVRKQMNDEKRKKL